MKRIILIVCLLIILPVLLFAKETVEKEFYGRIICHENDYIEVKKGRVEHNFYFTESTKVIKNENETTLNSIEICQVVNVIYSINNNRKDIIKVVIIKESNCYKKVEEEALLDEKPIEETNEEDPK